MDDKTYEDRVIKITDLVGDDGLLDGFTFIGCHIKGPAVIWLAGSTLSNNVLSRWSPCREARSGVKIGLVAR